MTSSTFRGAPPGPCECGHSFGLHYRHGGCKICDAMGERCKGYRAAVRESAEVKRHVTAERGEETRRPASQPEATAAPKEGAPGHVTAAPSVTTSGGTVALDVSPVEKSLDDEAEGDVAAVRAECAKPFVRTGPDWFCPLCAAHVRSRVQCCNPQCEGMLGTGCYHCHHPAYIVRVEGHDVLGVASGVISAAESLALLSSGHALLVGPTGGEFGKLLSFRLERLQKAIKERNRSR